MAPHALIADEEEVSNWVTTNKTTHFLEDLENYLPLGCLHLLEGANLQKIFGNVSGRSLKEFADSLVPVNHSKQPGISTALAKLLGAGWIRLSCPPGVLETCTQVLRVHILPHDVGRRYVKRESKDLQNALQQLLHEIDISPSEWSGECPESYEDPIYFDPWATAEDCSLFYLFNTLPSPAPRPDLVSDRFGRLAIKQLMDPEATIYGLKTSLYPYQARSAAMMIQRETAVQLQLDPRIEPRTAPDGQKYYFDARQCAFIRNARYYDTNRGGILAETMGLGKTIICLAVILATKHHLPQTPGAYVKGRTVRSEVASLSSMAAASLQRASIPARAFFSKYAAETGQEMTQCLRAIEAEPADYLIPGQPLRMKRQTGSGPPTRMRLSSGTIIVVPGNLVHQWKAELEKHVNNDETGLRTLIMDSGKQKLPSIDDLLTYDVVLFSRSRFEQEVRDGADEKGRRRTTGATPLSCQCPYIGATRTPDCRCLKDEDLYQSPIKQLHWLRIIIDEGHEFSSSSSVAVTVANTLVTAERRWVVSGTPARDRLFGVEMDLAVNDDLSMLQSLSVDDNESVVSSRDMALEQRRHFDGREEATGAARSLGLLASHFLKVKPWTEASGETRVEWDDYIFRHEDRRRTFSAFSSCLRRTMEGLIVKTQPDDVERDIVLPPLEHRVVYLDPSFHDKAIYNLFVLFLTANAVTSEREDKDYLFHKDSAKARGHLLANLRQSSFFWTGFTEKDVLAAIGHGETYLEKPREEVKCTERDRTLLSTCLAFAHMLLTVVAWKSLSKTHEIGLFVNEWPDDSRDDWNLNGEDKLLMTGVTQLLQAQTFVNSQLLLPQPTDGLSALGKAAITQAYEVNEEKPKKSDHSQKSQGETSMIGVPASGLNSDTSSVKHHYAVSTGKSGLSKKRTKGEKGNNQKSTGSEFQDELPKLLSLSPSKRKKSAAAKVELSQDSPLRRPSVIGTTSAKLSYLIDRIIELHSQEKILVFYDGENTAYYVAQCLELLHIKHLIYAKSLKLESKSKYIVTFDRDESVRVLLMDIRCGALGLNVNKASRVFFVNPCNRPSIEAQAIKRAHRIGQDKPVYVETLILKGTIEERVFKRSKAMTRTEHVETRILEDDEEISNIIKGAQPLPLQTSDGLGQAQMAALQTPQQLFGRAGRDNSHIKGIDKEKDEADGTSEPQPKRKRLAKTPGLQATSSILIPEHPAENPTGGRTAETEATIPIRSPVHNGFPSLFGNGASSTSITSSSAFGAASQSRENETFHSASTQSIFGAGQ